MKSYCENTRKMQLRFLPIIRTLNFTANYFQESLSTFRIGPTIMDSIIISFIFGIKITFKFIRHLRKRLFLVPDSLYIHFLDISVVDLFEVF